MPCACSFPSSCTDLAMASIMPDGECALGCCNLMWVHARAEDYQHKALEALQTQAQQKQQQQQPQQDEDSPDGLDEVLAACEDMAARIRSLVGDTSQDRCFNFLCHAAMCMMCHTALPSDMPVLLMR